MQPVAAFDRSRRLASKYRRLTLSAAGTWILLVISLGIVSAALLNLAWGQPIGGYANPVFFTATAMIGMIALAGIIVRNSILLVDFIEQELEAGLELGEAVIKAATVRAKPIILTALAAMLGSFFILDDPILMAWRFR